MNIILASHNAHKIAEINKLLLPLGGSICVFPLDSIGFSGEIEENGSTFEANSEIKAAVPISFGKIGLADDSGLEVDALNGEPGVYSARYSGEPCDDKRNNRKLLEKLAEVPKDRRTARFVSVITLLFPENDPLYSFDGTVLNEGTLIERILDGGPLNGHRNYRGFSVRGECEGVILGSERGNGGFGYDPLFYVEKFGKTFAELTSDEKNEVSHRGNAMRKFASQLDAILRSFEGKI